MQRTGYFWLYSYKRKQFKLFTTRANIITVHTRDVNGNYQVTCNFLSSLSFQNISLPQGCATKFLPMLDHFTNQGNQGTLNKASFSSYSDRDIRPSLSTPVYSVNLPDHISTAIVAVTRSSLSDWCFLNSMPRSSPWAHIKGCIRRDFLTRDSDCLNARDSLLCCLLRVSGDQRAPSCRVTCTMDPWLSCGNAVATFHCTSSYTRTHRYTYLPSQSLPTYQPLQRVT